MSKSEAIIKSSTFALMKKGFRRITTFCLTGSIFLSTAALRVPAQKDPFSDSFTPEFKAILASSGAELQATIARTARPRLPSVSG